MSHSTILAAFATLAFVGQLRAQEPDPAYLTVNPYLGPAVPSYDSRVSPYSNFGAENPYTTDGGNIWAQDGT
jgi:hypothetical protein